MFHHLFWPAFFEHSICRKLQAQLRPSCFWIVEQDAVVECSKHCFEVADRTCEASILSLCSLFKLQRCPMLTETMFPLSATFNSLPDCWSCAEESQRNRILTNDRFLSHSFFSLLRWLDSTTGYHLHEKRQSFGFCIVFALFTELKIV